MSSFFVSFSEFTKHLLLLPKRVVTHKITMYILNHKFRKTKSLRDAKIETVNLLK